MSASCTSSNPPLPPLRMPRFHATPPTPQAALDTIAFNGHGTAAESLWAAVPVITLPGDSICNRVGAAVSIAAGQTALIARSLDDYVLLVQRVLLRPRVARALKRQLRAQRDTAPLWNIKRSVSVTGRGTSADAGSAGTHATGNAQCACRGRRRCITSSWRLEVTWRGVNICSKKKNGICIFHIYRACVMREIIEGKARFSVCASGLWREENRPQLQRERWRPVWKRTPLWAACEPIL